MNLPTLTGKPLPPDAHGKCPQTPLTPGENDLVMKEEDRIADQNQSSYDFLLCETGAKLEFFSHVSSF